MKALRGMAVLGLVVASQAAMPSAALGASDIPPMDGFVGQEFSLNAGWNLIWLNVDPEPSDVGTVLQEIDYTSIHSPEALLTPAGGGVWYSHYREIPDDKGFVNTLKSVQSRRGYWLLVPRASTLRVVGRPATRSITLAGPAWNLFGALVDITMPATYDRWFSSADAQGKITPVFQFQDGALVQRPTSGPIVSNLAAWVWAKQPLSGSGPVECNVPRDGIQFGSLLTAFELQVRVPMSAQVQTITVRMSSSGSTDSAGGSFADSQSGDSDWLEYLSSEDQTWHALADNPATLSVDPGKTLATLPLRCNRMGRAVGVPYRGVVEVRDARGCRVMFGASMEKASEEGVWIGSARLTLVGSHPDVPPGGATGLYVAKPFLMPLILEIDGSGKKALLDRVTVPSERDGQPVLYEYNALLFHERVPLDSQGRGELLMDAMHPWNPYRHRYNPEHSTGIAMTRRIQMTFLDSDPDPILQGLGMAESVGGNRLMGHYEEQLLEGSSRPIAVKGTFRLQRLSARTAEALSQAARGSRVGESRPVVDSPGGMDSRRETIEPQ